MYKHILIAVDGTKPANNALVHALRLAKLSNARVTAVTVTEMWSPLDMAREAGAATDRTLAKPVQDFEKSAAKWAAGMLANVAEAAKKAGIPCETVHITDRDPARGIVDTAKSKKCDLIVMGSHGRRGLEKLLLGSQASKVLALSKIPVLVHR